jgi:hypothetical protein
MNKTRDLVGKIFTYEENAKKELTIDQIYDIYTMVSSSVNIDRRYADRLTYLQFKTAIGENYEIVNREGKLTKRIKNALKKTYDIKLSADLVSQIGNYIYDKTQNYRSFRFWIDDDMNTNGEFGDSGSCFMVGGCYRSNFIAMQNSDDHLVIKVQVKNKSGEYSNYARAWVWHNYNQSVFVLFNGYNLKAKPIGDMLIAAIGDHNWIIDESSSFRTSVYMNGDYRIIRQKTDGEYYNDRFDDCVIDEGITTCYECGDTIDEYETYYVMDHDYCENCYCELFSTCDRCEEHMYRDDAIAIDHGEQYYCEYCADNHSYKCDECDDYFSEDCIYCVIDDSGDEIMLCDECVDDHSEYCSQCGDRFTDDALIEIDDELLCRECRTDDKCFLCGKITDRDHLVGEHCAQCNDHLSSIDQCPDCKDARKRHLSDAIAHDRYIYVWHQLSNNLHYHHLSKRRIDTINRYDDRSLCDRHRRDRLWLTSDHDEHNLQIFDDDLAVIGVNYDPLSDRENINTEIGKTLFDRALISIARSSDDEPIEIPSWLIGE